MTRYRDTSPQDPAAGARADGARPWRGRSPSPGVVERRGNAGGVELGAEAGADALGAAGGPARLRGMGGADGATDRRGQRLEELENWEEVELRLRHRWSPYRVVKWYKERLPTDDPPIVRTLYSSCRARNRHGSWNHCSLSRRAKERLPRVLALKEQASLIETMIMRSSKTVAMESSMNGLLYPELRANIELLDRMLARHLASQAGDRYGAKVTQGGKEPGRDDLDDNQTRKLRELVSRIINLPSEEFIPTLVARIGSRRSSSPSSWARWW